MLEKIIEEGIVQEIKKQINCANKIVILSHVSPDGDAVGSSLALYHFLNQFKKTVHVLVPNDFPHFFRWMNGSEKIVISELKKDLSKQLIEQANLIFCLDFNSICRIGHLEKWIKVSSAKKILVDHHPFPEKFCDIMISSPEASSTSELIFRFIYQIKMIEKMNLSCAECIYTGIMTDTGIFTYNSDRISIYHIIQKLLAKGIKKDAIYNQIYLHYSEEHIRLQGYVLYKKMKILENYHTALMILSHEEQRRFQCKKGDTEGLVNIPLAIEKVIFSVLLKEEEEKKIKFSFRSKGDFPSNQFASEFFQGGGHLNAAGGKFNGTIEDAIKLFEKSLSKYKQLLISHSLKK